MLHDEADGEVDERRTRLVGEQRKLFDSVELGGVLRVAGVVRAGAHFERRVSGRVVDLAGLPTQPAASQRAPWDDTHVVLLGDAEHVGLDAAHEQRVRRLLGDDPAEAAAFGDPLVLDRAVCRERRRTEGPDLALALEVGECSDRLAVVGVGTVDMVDIDPIGLEPLQAVPDLLHDSAPRVVAVVRVACLAHRYVHRVAELRGEDDVVTAASREGFADDDLGLPWSRRRRCR